jgi:tripartite-type tricarboxylate transporter receptor subunit TctC
MVKILRENVHFTDFIVMLNCRSNKCGSIFSAGYLSSYKNLMINSLSIIREDNMKRKITIVFAVIFTLVLIVSNYSAGASDYPNRDITFIVPWGTGGAGDPVARMFVNQLEKTLHASINIVNKPGGSATIGNGIVVRAKPDGYTMGLASNSSLAFQPLLHSSVPYKSTDDYQPIVKLVELPVILSVRADAPWNTFDEFIADARKYPGKIRASTSGLYSHDDRVIRKLNKVAGVRITPVPLTGGGGEAMVALLGGRVEATVRYPVSTLPFSKAGKVKVLGAFTKGKHSLFPEVPPIGDTYGAAEPLMYCVIAPKGMPKEILDKMVNASLQAAQTPEFIAFAETNGYFIDVKGPDALKEELMNFSADYTELVKEIEKK